MSITSNLMAEHLKKYDIVPRKTNIVTFPFSINEDLYPHVIRGIFDGDGCISNNIITFCGNYFVVSAIKGILEQKLKINKIKIIERKGCYSFSFSSQKDVKNFYNYIYNNSTIFLFRKKERFDKLPFIDD